MELYADASSGAQLNPFATLKSLLYRRRRVTRSVVKRTHQSAKTVRTCRQLLKVEPALWLFVQIEGVEPTNNAAERAIRPAVIW